ncbi:1-acyl-sn-glycerol-3-phosphate acyltransferase [Terrabacter sp. NPDC080008]|uniref:1-acyl-sn-glycerol-3-phosphate acyltransferase n=1 Tax=Terrabacter sp. NPDC080008 TaxID=3155176 RepID=UPI00344D436A
MTAETHDARNATDHQPGDAPSTGATAPGSDGSSTREAAAKKTAAKKATAKRTTPKKSTVKKSTAKASKSAAKKASTTVATAAETPAKSTAAKTASASSKPAGGAFAAGAARASGERRRRSGTPLLPPSPVEVSAARRDLTGSAPDSRGDGLVETDEIIESAAMTEGPTEPESTVRPGRPVRPSRQEPAATGTPADLPADLPAEPTPARTRPTRASVRSTRRSATGAPTRLRAVPPVEEGAASATTRREAATRHTASEGEAGWEQALAALQSRAAKLVGSALEGTELSQEARPGPAELVDLAVNVLRAAAGSAGVPAEDVERQVAETLAYLRRRLSGDYVVDEFGFDEDYTVNVHLPLLRPLYRSWFRVEVRGIENIPDVGGALVVGNHSGTIALDSLMTQVAVYDEHPKHRHLRMLGADLVFQTPFIGTMARRSGTTLAANTDAERLLDSGALVGVWPEGFKGVGKPFSERYKLQRFGRGGFVSAALRAGVPIVPVSIVGAEEIYPILGNMPAVARLLGLPYAPITPTFPLLGPLGLVPLPSKWLIEFGPPIDTSSFGPEAADDPMLVFDLTDQVRETIQQTLYSLLMQRRSVFL